MIYIVFFIGYSLLGMPYCRGAVPKVFSFAMVLYGMFREPCESNDINFFYVSCAG